MWIDYDVQRTTRRCAVTDRPLAAGEEFFSVLAPPANRPDSDLVERRDLCQEAWQGPPEDAIGWWRARIADGGSGKAKLAPNEVLLDLFDRWSDEPQQAEARYVLALLLVRRRILRQDDSHEPTDPTLLRLFCPSRDAYYDVPVAAPNDQRAAEIQSELFQLLYADSR